MAPFSYAEERKLIKMAADSATLEEATATFRTSIKTIEEVAERLNLRLKKRAGENERPSPHARLSRKVGERWL